MYFLGVSAIAIGMINQDWSGVSSPTGNLTSILLFLKVDIWSFPGGSLSYAEKIREDSHSGTFLALCSIISYSRGAEQLEKSNIMAKLVFLASGKAWWREMEILCFHTLEGLWYLQDHADTQFCPLGLLDVKTPEKEDVLFYQSH